MRQRLGPISCDFVIPGTKWCAQSAGLRNEGEAGAERPRYSREISAAVTEGWHRRPIRLGLFVSDVESGLQVARHRPPWSRRRCVPYRYDA